MFFSYNVFFLLDTLDYRLLHSLSLSMVGGGGGGGVV